MVHSVAYDIQLVNVCPALHVGLLLVSVGIAHLLYLELWSHVFRFSCALLPRVLYTVVCFLEREHKVV